MSVQTTARPIRPSHDPDGAEGPEVSVLMPCLNEARTVETCIRKARACLERLGVCGEVIVADNGSTDGSQAIAERAGARVVSVAAKGYGSALLAGIAAGRGRFVIMADADDSYDFSELGPFIEKLREGFELVMGNRFAGGIAPGAMPPLHRYLGNPVLTGLGRLFFHSPCGDFHCGLRPVPVDPGRPRLGQSWANLRQTTGPATPSPSDLIPGRAIAICCTHRAYSTTTGLDRTNLFLVSFSLDIQAGSAIFGHQ